VTRPVQTFTVSQAAEVCQVSRKTITRRYEQLKLGGAYKDKAGQWAIPVAALLHAGLTPGRPAAPDTVSSTQASALGQQDTATNWRPRSASIGTEPKWPSSSPPSGPHG